MISLSATDCDIFADRTCEF